MRHAIVSSVTGAALAVSLVVSLAASAAPRSAPDSLPIPDGLYQSFFRIDGVRRELPVRAFWLDAAPVTRGEYLEFVRHDASWRRSHIKAVFAEENYLADWSDDLHPGEGADEPVTYVSWFAARAYCASRGKRLPTVAEWERVAGTEGRAPGAASPVPGASSGPFRFAMGHVAPDLSNRPLAVGRVWEWNADFNSALVAGRSLPGKPSSLFCGDGYRSTNASDYGAFLRYSFRASLRANYALKNLGFRCAQDSP